MHPDVKYARAPRRRRRKFLRFVGYTIVALMLLGLFVLLGSIFGRHVATSADAVQRWSAAGSAIRRWGLLVQTTLVALVIAAWRPLVNWGRRRDIVKAEEYQRVLALRWHAALIGVAYLILIPIGPTTLWQLFAGA